ncbi:hypothetical protein [Holospora curviuscula]|uniref:Uncharacterized protein n=1 Tax=Holospora curviuscula TaxID=1082868 RepID=A0A2S5RHY4_9PROT|nr:hypothetical protein [Holospora curviuscula]PPE06931.1 hypothetical protein HCUR_00044 [Holospora curviuscula]
MDTRLSLVLVQQYEAMIFHLYGSSFLKNLGYSLWITTKNFLLISIFCLPLYGLGYTVRFFFNTSLSLQIGGLVLLSSVSMGYFLLVPWWIHHNISRTYGMLTVAYQFSLMSLKIMLFELPLILSWGLLSILFSSVVDISKAGFVPLVTLVLFKYLFFRWNKHFFINAASGRVEMSNVLKNTLVQALEDDFQNFLNKSWLHWLFYTFLNLLKFLAFLYFLSTFFILLYGVYFVGVMGLSRSDKVTADLSLLFSLIPFLTILCFPLIVVLCISSWIHRRYVGGMWALLHNVTCGGTIMMATPYMIGFYILFSISIVSFNHDGYNFLSLLNPLEFILKTNIHLNSFSILTPLGFISMGILMAISYCTFKVYKQNFSRSS